MSQFIERQQAIANGNHAVVIGSSMAGLLAARILVDHFDNVTVIERDRLPQQPESRHGTPQANHVHVLLNQGERILEQMFPGLEAELTTAGAPNINLTADFPFLGLWGWFPRFHSNLSVHACSRLLLEWTVRRRLTAFSNLQFLPETQVIGLLSDNSNSQIKGVKLRCSDIAQENELTADLVIDASGRNSSLPKWLEVLGYSSPSKTVVNSFLGYSTRWYELPENFQADWKGLVVAYKPPHDKHAAVLYPVEGERWVVTLSGIGRDYPPTDEAGFLEFARSLRTPIIYEAIKDAKPLSPVYAYRRTENCWHHYEKLSKMPENLVAMGDAVCAFNPFYGQGMTTAALSALTLDKCLKEQLRSSPNDLTGLTQNFQKQLAQILETPWMMATSEDFRWETTKGAQTDGMTQLMQRYADQVARLAVNHPDVYQTYLEVIHMIKPPIAFFAPSILARVLGQVIKSHPDKTLLTPELAIPKLP